MPHWLQTEAHCFKMLTQIISALVHCFNTLCCFLCSSVLYVKYAKYLYNSESWTKNVDAWMLFRFWVIFCFNWRVVAPVCIHVTGHVRETFGVIDSRVEWQRRHVFREPSNFLTWRFRQGWLELLKVPIVGKSWATLNVKKIVDVRWFNSVGRFLS